jgi:molybdopterin biosynthesis enzyme|eukprot:COSAG02_NODE_18846_length_914_cov_1.608589_1_plen_97_part_00
MLKLKKLKAEADAKKALETEAAAAGKKAVAKTSAGELILQKGGRSSAEDRAAHSLFPATARVPCHNCAALPGLPCCTARVASHHCAALAGLPCRGW